MKVVDTTFFKSLEKLSTIVKNNYNYGKKSDLVLSQKLSYLEKEENASRDGPISSLANTAEAALTSIDEKLSKIKDYAMEIEENPYTYDEKLEIQEEIDNLKSEIVSLSEDTEFNSVKLLDGTFQDVNVAATPNGSGVKMSIQNTSLESLGIADFDVTGAFDVDTVDNAIDKINNSKERINSLNESLGKGIGVINTNRENTLTSDINMFRHELTGLINSIKSEQMIKQYEYYSAYREPNKDSEVDLFG